MTTEPITQADRALMLLRQRGMARLSEFKTEGIAEKTVTRLESQGRVVRLARGLYQLPDAELDANHTLAEAAKLVPKGVICLISALQFHGLTVQTPSAVWMAIERSARKPNVNYPPLRVVRFGGAAYSMGIVQKEIERVAVQIYDPAKSVVDCFRYRNKIGLDVAIEALREGLRERYCEPDDLWRYAKATRAWTVMRPYLETMLADGA